MSKIVEEWRPVTGRFPQMVAAGRAGWLVSNLGRILDPNGHPAEVTRRFYGLEGVVFPPCEPGGSDHLALVVQVVAEAWVPNPHGSTRVRRIVKDPDNNRADNLVWRRPTQKPIELGPIEGERWVAVPDCDGYEVSDHGRVRRGGKILKPLRGHANEPLVYLYRADGSCRPEQVRNLVGQAFLPRKMDDNQIRRRAGVDPLSCRASDLEWVTDRKRRLRSFRRPNGSPARSSRLDPEWVAEARLRYSKGERQVSILRDFQARGCKVSAPSLSLAIRRRTWQGV